MNDVSIRVHVVILTVFFSVVKTMLKTKDVSRMVREFIDFLNIRLEVGELGDFSISETLTKSIWSSIRRISCFSTLSLGQLCHL